MPQSENPDYSPQQEAAQTGQTLSIASVTSFILEFNQNVQIFSQAIILVADFFAATQEISNRHEAKIDVLIERTSALRDDLDKLMRFGRLYRPAEESRPGSMLPGGR
jgi:hypothetical protein